MITKFKIFEKINVNLHNLYAFTSDAPKNGDYVILFPYMFKDKIGQISRIRTHYNEIDVDFGGDIGKIFGMSIDSIKYWSENKEELETLLQAKKYNL